MADKFRRAKVPRHVRIYHRQMQSEAWRHLSGSAVKVLLAMASLENGDNNGEFFLSARTGAKMTGLGKNAVNRALHELQDKGFAYCAERGGFSRKTPHAACWGLTWQAGPKGSEHRAPSHAYDSWRPTKKCGLQNEDGSVPETGSVDRTQDRHCPQNGDSETAEMAGNRQSALSSNQGHILVTSPPELGAAANDSLNGLENHRGLSSLPFGWWHPVHGEHMAKLVLAAVLAEQLGVAIGKRKLAA